jgi:D-galactarolactone cycloisomerase
VSVTLGSIDPIVLSLPTLPSEPASSWQRRLETHLIIRVGTGDPDLVGWGESFAIGAAGSVAGVIRDVIGPVLAGRRYEDPRDAVGELQRDLHQFARSGIGQYALSGVDIALWDLAGKMQGRTVAALLGETKRRRIPAMASLLRYETPSDVANATESWLAAGFGSVKLHQQDVESVREAIVAAGDPGRVALDLTPFEPSTRSGSCGSRNPCGRPTTTRRSPPSEHPRRHPSRRGRTKPGCHRSCA